MKLRGFTGGAQGNRVNFAAIGVLVSSMAGCAGNIEMSSSSGSGGSGGSGGSPPVLDAGACHVNTDPGPTCSSPISATIGNGNGLKTSVPLGDGYALSFEGSQNTSNGLEASLSVIDGECNKFSSYQLGAGAATTISVGILYVDVTATSVTSDSANVNVAKHSESVTGAVNQGEAIFINGLSVLLNDVTGTAASPLASISWEDVNSIVLSTTNIQVNQTINFPYGGNLYSVKANSLSVNPKSGNLTASVCDGQ